MRVYDHVSGRLSELDQQVVRHVPPGGNWRDLPEGFASQRIQQIRDSAAAGEGSRSTYYGRLQLGRPSYTISTYFNRPGNGCFIHPTAARLITVREAARLQSFPDSFRFSGKGRARFLQVGNAVPPLLAFQLARAFPPGRFVDLFAGAGGMSLGFEWASHELVQAVDNDSASLATLCANGVSESCVTKADLGDETHLSEFLDSPELQDLDWLIGGPPCQGFSTAGKNLNDDPRNRLVGSFLTAVRRLRPARVLMENVPALMFRRRRATLDAIVNELSSFGYEVEVSILHAEGYGVPQLRRRLFIQASRDAPIVWPTPCCEIHDPSQIKLQPHADLSPRQRARTVEDAISDLPERTSADPDECVDYAAPPASDYEQWARGELAAAALVPPGPDATSQLNLAA